jgi:hypothetical protein
MDGAQAVVARTALARRATGVQPLTATGQHRRRSRHTAVVTTYEKTGTVSMGTAASGVAVVGSAAGATAAIGVALKMIVQPAAPEPGYHLAPDAHDLIGGGLMIGLGVAALYATFRALRLRDLL